MKTGCFHHNSILSIEFKFQIMMKTPCFDHNLILSIEFRFKVSIFFFNKLKSKKSKNFEREFDTKNRIVMKTL